MKAAVVHDFNASPRYGDFADPVAEPGETLVQVRAAALSQLVKSQASGRHYSSGKTLPLVPGVDGVGLLPDGRRVYFAFPRGPFGAMAHTTVVKTAYCVPVPDDVDDVTAAAIGNPGMSSWAALTERAHFQRGENVLINGATGVSGRLAIQIARHLGANKVIVTGRNAKSIEGLAALGADVLIPLDAPAGALTETFRDTLRSHRVDVILDYLYGPSAESLLGAVGGHSGEAEPRIRFVQIGSLAGNTINVPASALRSSGLEMMGSGLGSVSNERLLGAIGGLLKAVVSGGFSIEADAVPLTNVESAWTGEASARTVFTV
ncbi:MAG: zinc-binding alcohol dehydrogenase family protein [Paraburkholderia sp.]|uniref:quinone oxidoreductase family protein n=1 Tax=Paraburkholderia sp. TaxID=1926495 RepID=UPI0011F432CD|nr:zinc-binding alcohol dehydrogenase family protein [Paraburkholderia sp.]TAL94284.1 MAG: zinc-binding alcohol dehydrogenase family protein [Paraburkholderia sp.]